MLIEKLPLKKQNLIYSEIDFYLNKHVKKVNITEELNSLILISFEELYQSYLDKEVVTDPLNRAIDGIEGTILLVIKDNTFTESLDIDQDSVVNFKTIKKRSIKDKLFAKFAFVIQFMFYGYIIIWFLNKLFTP